MKPALLMEHTDSGWHRLNYWHSNGAMADSAVYNTDSSGIEVSWFDNGKPFAAGGWAAVVVTFTVDVNGQVKDAYISVPFYGTFNTEVLRSVLNCPKWHSAIEHNRRVEDSWSQAVVFKNGDLSTTVIKD